MKDHQFNLLYGTSLAIFSQVVEPDWRAGLASIVAICYIVTGLIQHIMEE